MRAARFGRAEALAELFALGALLNLATRSLNSVEYRSNTKFYCFTAAKAGGVLVLH
jgi:hypothetical protein